MRGPGTCACPRQYHPLRRSCNPAAARRCWCREWQTFHPVAQQAVDRPALSTAGSCPAAAAGPRGTAASNPAAKPACRTIELQCLPRPQAFAHLFGELRRVRGGTERLGGEDACCLMVLSPASAVRTHRDDDVGSEHPDVADEISEDLLLTPLLERLLLAERVAEVDRSREVLLRAVETVGGQQFLGAEHTQRIEELGTNLVLTAVAAGRRDERHACADVARIERQRRIVFVVRVRGHVDDRTDRRQLPQRQRQGRRAGQVGERLDTILRNGLLGTGRPLQRGRRRGGGGQESPHFHRGLPSRNAPEVLTPSQLGQMNQVSRGQDRDQAMPPSEAEPLIGLRRKPRWISRKTVCVSCLFGCVLVNMNGNPIPAGFVYTRCQPALRRHP